jgi:hypothetical protein
MHHGFHAPRFRRPLRSALITVAFVAGVVLALAGAVLGVVVLAIGALLHAAYKSLRRPVARPAAHPDPRVIEGEFIVVSGPGAHGGRPLQGADRA